jgi:hypothetical protein
MFNTPILFIIFNRLRTTPKAFECIRQIQPKHLYIAADGPRLDKLGEAEVCKQTRELVLSMIDWPCEVKTLFRDENWGCGKGVSEAITWFFDQVEEGIILEDDCIPDPSFFTFCEVLLDRYRDNPKIMHIGGNNFQFGQIRGDGDYYYSAIPHIWGWATWKRAWDKYDFILKGYSEHECLKILKSCYQNDNVINYWTNIFNSMSKGLIDTWDYQWHYIVLKNNGISISPNVNLVQNIGFGIDATHTLVEEDWNMRIITETLKSFNKPSLFSKDHAADEFTMKKIFKVDYQPKQEIKTKQKKSNVILLIKKVFKVIIPKSLFIF